MMMMALTYKWEKTSKEETEHKSSEDAYVLKGDNQHKLHKDPKWKRIPFIIPYRIVYKRSKNLEEKLLPM